MPPKNEERRLSRRGLLKTLGLAAAASPFLPLLNASGQEASMPRRLVLFFTPHGTIRDEWLPTGGETDFVLPRILQPLERHRSRLLVLDGLHVRAGESVGAPHTKGPPLLWTGSPLREDMTFSRDEPGGTIYFGWNSGPSVDQVIAERVGTELPYRSLELGVKSGYNHPGHRMIYRGPEQPLSPEADPHALLDRLFGDGSGAAAQARRRAERRSVLDAVKGELGPMRGRVAAADREKVDSHLEAIREIERALQGMTSCDPVDIGAPVDPFADPNIPVILEAQMKILAQALACDMTRVASLQYRVGENDGSVYEWLGVDREQHHLITHENNASAEEELTTIYTWYAEKFGGLLDLLDVVPEGDGTMLDNTLVVWGSEIGRGWDHSFDNIPFVLAGGASGAVRPGRFLSYEDVEHNRLLVSLCHAMGLSDIDTFGSLDTGSGPLPGLI